MNNNIQSVKKACTNLDLSYKVIDSNDLLIEVKIGTKQYYFIQNIVPLNSQSISRICSDKEYTYLLLKDHVKMPVTFGFLDPFVDAQYAMYTKQQAISEIINAIQQKLALPLILKRNRGSTGNNVFLCNSSYQLTSHLHTIFNKHSQHYDYVALAQEYILIKEEYRVITLDGKIQFAYRKDNTNAQYEGNLSPLHWKGAKAVLIDNQDSIVGKLQNMIDKMYIHFAIPYAGFDIALDKNGTLQLIEINSQPSFGYFITDNGDQKVVELYEQILQKLIAQSTN